MRKPPGRQTIRGLVTLSIAMLAASSCAAHAATASTGPTTSSSSVVTEHGGVSGVHASITGVAVSRRPSGDSCSEASGVGVKAPLATYGDTDTAELRFGGGLPPTARLCGSFHSDGRRQEGSASSTSGPLAYLFGLVETGKVSTGGGYYWVGGAVDKTVGSVVVSFSETPDTIKVALVPLPAGWRGFAFEYSPGPFYYSPTGPGETPPRNAGLTFTATDTTGRPLDSRYLDLDTGAQHEATAPATR